MDIGPLFYIVPFYLALFASPAPVNGLGTTILDGDVFVQVFAAMYSTMHANGTCSGIESESVQNVEAIKWAFNELNNIQLKGIQGYIPGVKIGVRLFETCRSAKKAKELAYALSNEMMTDFNSGGNAVMGIIGSEYSSETDVISRIFSSLPDHQRLLQLTYSSTSAFLKNREIYGNLFRLIPRDDIQVEVMLDLLARFNWTYVALLYDDDAYGNGGKDALLAGIKSRDICFPVTIPINTSVYDIKALENTIKNDVLNADPPISGVLIFGSYLLADAVLKATTNVLADEPNTTYPAFLFSEAAGYIEGHSSNVSNGAFIVSPTRRTIDEFQSEWENMFLPITNIYAKLDNNTWLRNVYADKFGCYLAEKKADNTCKNVSKTELNGKIPVSVYNQYAVQASLVMAKVIKLIHKTKCNDVNGICNAMLTTSRNFLIDTMQDLTVDFDNDFGGFRITAFRNPNDLILTFNQSVEARVPTGFPVYEVYNRQLCAQNGTCLEKVAQFHTETRLAIDKSSIKDYDRDGNVQVWPNIRKPQCPDNHLCARCLSAGNSNAYSTLFVPGDLYIVGLVPVHNIGPTPLQCDGIKAGGVDIVEAIRFAVNEAETVFTDNVPDATIGVIIIDGCNDPQIVQEKMLTLHRLGVYNDGSYIPVGDKIIGYIGGWSSDVSKSAGAITTRLGYPQISYGSTAPILGKRSLYPYFMRIPSPDSEQALAILKIVEALDVNFIQVVYSETTYGEGGRDIILSLVKDKNICVAQTLGITEITNPASLVASLRIFSNAKAVVVFAASFELEKIVKYLNDNLLKNEFLFISSEGWGTRISVKGYTQLIGTITLSSELQLNNKFIDHMRDLKPDGSNSNPWIRPYMENHFNCYYEWSYNKTSGKECTGNERLDASQLEYRIDAWSTFAEKAVLALLQGAKTAMDKYCGHSDSICSNLRNNTDGFVDILEAVKLKDNNNFQSRIFDDNGEGLAGYKIYAVALIAEGDYKLIGNSEPSGFTFYKPLFNTIWGTDVTSSCGSQTVCRECFPLPTAPTEADAPVGFIVLAVILAVICCVLAAILLYICNRRGCCIKLENGRPRFTNAYLTPTYAKSSDFDINSSGNVRVRPTLPKRPGDENYDHIRDSKASYDQSSKGSRNYGSNGSGSGENRFFDGRGSSSGSWARQPPIGGREDSSHQGTHDSGVGTQASQMTVRSDSNPSRTDSNSSYLISKPMNAPRYQSGTGSAPAGSYIDLGEGKVLYQADGSKTSGSAPTSARSNIQQRGDGKIVYQTDGSYITSGSVHNDNETAMDASNSNEVNAMSAPVDARDIHIGGSPPQQHDTSSHTDGGGNGYLHCM